MFDPRMRESFGTRGLFLLDRIELPAPSAEAVPPPLSPPILPPVPMVPAPAPERSFTCWAPISRSFVSLVNAGSDPSACPPPARVVPPDDHRSPLSLGAIPDLSTLGRLRRRRRSLLRFGVQWLWPPAAMFPRQGRHKFFTASANLSCSGSGPQNASTFFLQGACCTPQSSLPLIKFRNFFFPSFFLASPFDFWVRNTHVHRHKRTDTQTHTDTAKT